MLRLTLLGPPYEHPLRHIRNLLGSLGGLEHIERPESLYWRTQANVDRGLFARLRIVPGATGRDAETLYLS